MSPPPEPESIPNPTPEPIPHAPARPARRGGKKLLVTCLILLIIGLLLVGSLIIYFLRMPGSGILDRVHREQARVLALSISHAIKYYHAEYQAMPVPDLNADAESKPIRSDAALTSALLGTSLESNPKRIRFLPDMKDASSGGYGLKLAGDAQPIIVDPWGEPFYIILDRNGDGSVPNPDSTSGSLTLLQPVIVFSAGPDKNPDTWDDNLKSWNALGMTR